MARKGSRSNNRRRSHAKGTAGGKRSTAKGSPNRRPAKSGGARRKKRSSQPALSFRALAAIWFGAGVALGLLILLPIYFASGPEEEERAPRPDPTRRGETPDYRFYDILPHTRVRPPEPAAPDSEEGDQAESGASRPGAPSQEEPPPVPADGRFFLQVASFQKRPDAERLKARLALKGLQARVVSAEVPGKGTWHRVRLGPFSEPQRLRSVEDQLRDAGIQPMRVRAGEG
jgi:hypothetical protein